MVDPPTVNFAAITAFAVIAVRTFAAQSVAVSLLATATDKVIGDPVIPAEVTTTEALPAPDAPMLPAAVAVSTWAVPAVHAVLLVLSRSEMSMTRSDALPTMMASKLTCFVLVSVTVSLLAPICTVPLVPDLVGVVRALSPKVARGLVRVMVSS